MLLSEDVRAGATFAPDHRWHHGPNPLSEYAGQGVTVFLKIQTSRATCDLTQASYVTGEAPFAL